MKRHDVISLRSPPLPCFVNDQATELKTPRKLLVSTVNIKPVRLAV